MKRILLISYYFPPLGMGGTQRLAAFARYLPEFGWQPEVLTVKDIAYFAYDPELLRGLENIPIHRTESLDPLRLLARLKRIDRHGSGAAGSAISGGGAGDRLRRAANLLLMPDNKIPWYPFALRRAGAILRQKPFDAILSSGPPHSTHLIAMRLAKKHRLPWIADFRDGWAGGDFQPAPTALHRKADARLQKRVLAGASHVVAVSDGLRDLLRQAAPQDTPISTITNGYDAADFQEPVQRNERFDAVHVGTVGGFVRALNTLVAFGKFVRENGLSPNDARLHFVGADISGRLQSEIRDCDLGPYAELHGYLPHSRAVAQMRQADLLLYLVDGEPYPGFIPGKTFEYLAAQRPILAAAPGIEGVRILLEGGATRWLQPDDVDGIARALMAFYLEFAKGEAIRPKSGFAARYERKRLTEKLARILSG